MAQPEKVIIDTDPGVDDVLAISLALNHPEKLHVLLFTLTHGNVGVEPCLKNLVALLGVLKAEREFRNKQGKRDLAFQKPIVAVGAGKPIVKEHAHGEPDHSAEWEGFHGLDGLNGLHARLSNLVSDDYRVPFDPDSPTSTPCDQLNFIPSRLPGHLEMLNQLRSHPSKTITIVGIGPCTNLALAAAEDPIAFARAKKIIIMGGAVRVPGNQTPRAEFNIYADPDAAADIFNLTSLSRRDTPEGQMDVALASLDCTSSHTLTRETWSSYAAPLLGAGSPLAHFLDAMLTRTFEKMYALFNVAIFGCHDGLPIHALLEPELVSWETGLDLRVETEGVWTRGETVFDARPAVVWTDALKAVIRDNGGWSSGKLRNSVAILKDSGVEGAEFGRRLLEGIFE